MNKNVLIKCYITIFWVSLLSFVSFNSFALNQNAKQWFAINAQQALDKNGQWYSYVYSQLRLVDRSHPMQAFLLEGAVGYHLAIDNILWAGYRWTGRNPYNNFYQSNRLFQQLVFHKKTSRYDVNVRSRLEEITRGDTGQVALRLRERLGLQDNRSLFKNIFLAISDEVYFQLNHPAYMPHTVLGQNRLFLGFNVFASSKVWWEIGYINQYSTHTMLQTQNQMSHIISITCNVLE